MKIPKQGSSWGAFRVLKHEIKYEDFVDPRWGTSGGGCEKGVKHTYVYIKCTCGVEMYPLLFEPEIINNVPGGINYMVEFLDCGCGAASKRGPILTPTGRFRRVDSGKKKHKEPRCMFTMTIPVSLKNVLMEWADKEGKPMSEFIIESVTKDMIALGALKVEEENSNA